MVLGRQTAESNQKGNGHVFVLLFLPSENEIQTLATPFIELLNRWVHMFLPKGI